MPFRSLSRLSNRARRALGVTELSGRLAALEAGVASLRNGDLYPRGPVYFGDHTVLTATRFGPKILVDTRDVAISPWIALDGLWETHITGWFYSALQPGQVFVDVGANVGYFTLLGAHLVGPAGRVVAVEAHPYLVEILRRNVVMNGMHEYVTICPNAAWSEPTELQFRARENLLGSSSVGSAGASGLARLGDSEKVLEVHAVVLDDVLDDLEEIHLVKVDVEGAELRVLKGLQRTIKRCPSMKVAFEWAPNLIEGAGDDPAELLSFLSGYGFRFRLFETDSPIDAADLRGVPYGNVLASR